MNILDFYNRLEIVPPNLVRHHLEVGAVTKHLLNHWQGEEIDKDLTLRTALLHDMGNLVKYTFPLEAQKYHEVIENEDFWYKKHKELVKKYGDDADLATETMLKEYGFRKETELLKEIREGKYIDDVLKISHEAKLVFLADGVVAPRGIVGVKARIADVKKRYAGNEKMPLWVEALRQNKEVIQEFVDFDLDELEKIDFSQEIEKLKTYDFPLAKS